jgi:hypothetical protein
MSRQSTSRTTQWRIFSAYVPKRDGRSRVEKVIRIGWNRTGASDYAAFEVFFFAVVP